MTEPEPVVADDALLDAFMRYRSAKATAGRAKALADECREDILRMLPPSCKVFTTQGHPLGTKTTTSGSSRIDSAKVRALYPEVAAVCTKVGDPSMVLRLADE